MKPYVVIFGHCVQHIHARIDLDLQRNYSRSNSGSGTTFGAIGSVLGDSRLQAIVHRLSFWVFIGSTGLFSMFGWANPEPINITMGCVGLPLVDPISTHLHHEVYQYLFPGRELGIVWIGREASAE